LPAQPTALIGRDRELTELRRQLLRPDVRLLTLTGAAGTGKTRLALEVAADLFDTFEHGSVFVELTPVRDPALVTPAIAAAVGVHDAGGQPLIETLKTFLRTRHVFLVLDNFEQVLAAAPLVAELLAASTALKALVTSRAALRLLRWEHEFPLPPLRVPDRGHPPPPGTLADVPAVALFVERARARRPGFALAERNASAVAEICIRLDGLPLAIELAAAGIKVLSPQAILTRLKHRLDLLAEGGGDFPARHHTLREAIGWSHDLLTARERVLFRRLAAFVGGFTLKTAEAVCTGHGIEMGDVLPLLAQLVDHSLVVAEERGADTRYRLLETIREYAAEQLHAAGEEALLRRRHADWFAQLGQDAEAELRGPGQSAWLDRLEADHDNLRAALGWLSESGEPETGLRLAAALWQLWWLRGYLTEGRRRLEALVAPAGATRRSAAWTKALHAAGVLAFRQGDYAAARSHLEESLLLARELADRSATASALRNLGRMAIDRGEFDGARRLLEQSLAIERELDSAFGTAWSLNYLGLLAQFEGDHAAARALLEQSLPVLRALGDQWGTAVALYYLGRVACDQADPSAAGSAWTESLEICRTQGYLWCVPYLLEGVGGLASIYGQQVQGVRLAGAAEALHESIGAPLPPVWRADLDRRLEPVRRRLGEAAFAAAWGEGRALPLDQAVAQALEAARRAVPWWPAGDRLPTRPEAQGRPPPPVSAAAPLETRYARSGDVSIAYQVVGHGPLDVVFVMGWVSHLDWFWQEPRFAHFLRRLAGFSRLILFDKRGTGLSDRAVELPTLEQRMDDVRAVMDAVGSERAALLGISEGGPLCALFAASYPERTRALVMIGSFPRRLWATDYPWGSSIEERNRFVEEIERGWGSIAWAARDLERRAPSVARDERFVRWWATYLRMSASPGAAAALVRMNSQIDIRQVLPAIRVPTLVVHRTGDQEPRVEVGRYMAERIPGAKYVEQPGDDHLPFVGDQDTLLDAVEEFLTGAPTAAVADTVVTTVLAMEVVDAAAVVAAVGEHRWREIEAAHAAVVHSEIERYRGRPAGRAAGAFLAAFDGPARAVRCVWAILDGTRPLEIELRAGLHTGECDVLDGELSGLPLRIAAWVMGQAAPGEILASSTVRDLVAGSTIEFTERDARLVEDAPGAWRVFRVGRHSPVASSPPPVGGPAPVARRRRDHPLTGREREVAVRIARGLTNRQIADELVISAATAERHVVNIFNKLGFHARSQLAAWVVEHGLGQRST
jgi:predicted ATPase/pimeloyl-ACP methyl ester carboxylesterase/DNA-binding CsgD family transcriptional regulator